MNLAPDIAEVIALEDLTVHDELHLSTEEQQSVPAWWHEVLSLPVTERVGRAVEEWKRVLPGRLSTYLQHLENTGSGILLARAGQLQLLYIARDIDDQRPVCWSGTTPCTNQSPGVSGVLPIEYLNFHTAIHDGFRQVSGLANGLVPLQELTALSNYFDTSEAEFYKTGENFDPESIDLSSAYGVFLNFDMSGYAVDTSNSDRPTAGWYWFENTLEPIPDFWAAINDAVLAETR